MAHEMWKAWFEGESTYQDNKWESHRQDHDSSMRLDGISPSGIYHHDINAYLHRAMVIGLEHPHGRQALAKAAMVAIAAVESAIRVYGPLPEPGHTSGEIKEWDFAANQR